jgi:hypothetical protein
MARTARRRRRRTPLPPPPPFDQARRDKATLIGTFMGIIVAGLLIGAGLVWLAL